MLAKVVLIAAIAAQALAQNSDSTTTDIFSPIPSPSDTVRITTRDGATGSGSGVATRTRSTSGTQSGSAQTTISAYLADQEGLVGSIIAADACRTTVAVQCTDSLQCPSTLRGVTLTYTQGPFDWQFTYSASTRGAVATLAEYCSFVGATQSPTAAVCTATLIASAAGTSTQTTTVSTLTGPSLTQHPLAITAGSTALAAATGTCTAKPNAAPTAGVNMVAGIGALALAGWALF